MYDSICKGFLDDKAQAVRTAISHDFCLHSIPYYAEDERSRVPLVAKDESSSNGERWGKDCSGKVLRREGVEFLSPILNLEPAERWTAQDILNCGYLEMD